MKLEEIIKSQSPGNIYRIYMLNGECYPTIEDVLVEKIKNTEGWVWVGPKMIRLDYNLIPGRKNVFRFKTLVLITEKKTSTISYDYESDFQEFILKFNLKIG